MCPSHLTSVVSEVVLASPIHLAPSPCSWRACPQCGCDPAASSSENCSVPPLPGLLFLAHTCCPSVGCDFRVSFEHSTLSPLNLILKLSCLVFKSLAKNVFLGLCDKLPIPCQGACHSSIQIRVVQGNRRPPLSYRAAHTPNASVPVSSKILTHSSGRDWNINSATWFPTQDTRVTRGTNQGPSGCVTCPHIHGLKGEIVYRLLEHACSFFVSNARSHLLLLVSNACLSSV